MHMAVFGYGHARRRHISSELLVRTKSLVQSSYLCSLIARSNESPFISSMAHDASWESTIFTPQVLDTNIYTVSPDVHTHSKHWCEKAEYWTELSAVSSIYTAARCESDSTAGSILTVDRK